jgi:hypothetical protein
MCYILETLLLAMFFASFSVVVETSTTTNCSMYLAKSRLQGLGVFAGRPYEKGTYTEEDLSLQIGLSELPDDFFTAWQLGYYVYGGYSNHEAVVFGPTMIYNHDDNSNLRFNLKPIWNWHYFMLTVIGLGAVLYFFYLDPTFNIEKPIYAGCIFGILIYVFPMPLLFNAGQHKVGYSLGPMFNFEVVRSVEVGSELFSKYGGNWFQDRNITKTHAQVQGSVYSLDELERIGVCLSNTYVAPSRIPNAGRGVFVHSDVLQGRVIEVTPALVHHKLKVADTSSLLINYIIASSESNVTLLPFGRIGFVSIQVALLFTKLSYCYRAGEPRRTSRKCCH